MILMAMMLVHAATPLQVWDLEQDDGNFSAGGDLRQWTWGTVAAGPGGGFDGENAWAIGLAGTYLNDSIEYLEFPPVDLAGVAMPVLRFAQWYHFGGGDGGFIEVNEGFGWESLEPTYGYPEPGGYAGVSGDWQIETVLLDGLVSNPRIRLVFFADLSSVGVGWFVDQVGIWDGDVSAPRVESLVQLSDTESLDDAYRVTATLSDDVEVSRATLYWSLNGETAGSTTMVQEASELWSGSIPAQSPDTTVGYWVEVTDGQNSTRSPIAGSLTFRVYLPAPRDIRGPAGRVVGNEAEISWSPPVSEHAVVGYRVERAGDAILDTTDLSSLVALTGSFDLFAVRALYAEGEGDPTETIEVDAVVPLITTVSPAEAWPGELLRFSLQGSYLLMVDGQVALSLEPDVSVESVDVIDVDRLVANVRIAESAAAGTRDVTVTSPSGVVRFVDGFSVLAAGERPALVAVNPDKVVQGDIGQLAIETQGTLDFPATVDLGAGIIVESVTVGEGKVLVEYAVDPNAALGERTVVLDDGTRILEGPTLTVTDYRGPVIGTCATLPVWPAGAASWPAGLASGPAGLAWLALLAAFSRRRVRRG